MNTMISFLRWHPILPFVVRSRQSAGFYPQTCQPKNGSRVGRPSSNSNRAVNGSSVTGGMQGNIMENARPLAKKSASNMGQQQMLGRFHKTLKTFHGAVKS